MATMKALVKDGSRVGLRRLPLPDLTAADEVRIRVALAGLCRTDLYVAEGSIPAADPLILGHEFAGTVESVGPAVRTVRPGDRVAVLPLVSCGRCYSCSTGDPTNCLDRAMLGMDRDGAFAEFVVLPARCVFPLTSSVSFLVGAYAEPVAAALAVLRAPIQPSQRGLILGTNRFARLVERLLRIHGFGDLTLADPACSAIPAGAFDFVLETGLSAESLRTMMAAARPGGMLILKSRPPDLVGLDVLAAIRKELTFHAVQYGPFARAVALLAEGQIDLADLLGPVFPLEDFASVFGQARSSESAKFFFAP
jgi:L-iditol 2-dehydrogenase